MCLSILHWDCHRALPEYPYERPWPIRGQMYRTIRAVYAVSMFVSAVLMLNDTKSHCHGAVANGRSEH